MARQAFQLPSLGMSMEDAAVEEWLVAVGDTVAEVVPVMSPSPEMSTLASAGSTANTSLVDWPTSMVSGEAWNTRIFT